MIDYKRNIIINIRRINPKRKNVHERQSREKRSRYWYKGKNNIRKVRYIYRIRYQITGRKPRFVKGKKDTDISKKGEIIGCKRIRTGKKVNKFRNERRYKIREKKTGGRRKKGRDKRGNYTRYMEKPEDRLVIPEILKKTGGRVRSFKISKKDKKISRRLIKIIGFPI